MSPSTAGTIILIALLLVAEVRFTVRARSVTRRAARQQAHSQKA